MRLTGKSSNYGGAEGEEQEVVESDIKGRTRRLVL